MNRQQRRAQMTRAGKAQALPAASQRLFDAAVEQLRAGMADAAEQLFARVLTAHPRHADSLHLLGTIAWHTGRHDAAFELVSKAVASDPTNASSHSNLGNLLAHQGRFEEAIAAHRRSLALRPDSPATLNNLANALKGHGSLDEAIGIYRRSIAFAPNEAETHYNLAMALLAQGDMAAGWPEHEWRWRTRQFMSGRRGFRQPLWRGEAAEEQALLIHAEQGFGDTLQFCRFATLAAARVARVIMEVQAPLVRLIAGLPGVDQVVAAGEPLPPFDLHCPMLGLPLAFGTTIETIPAAIPYLSVDPALAGRWRERLQVTETVSTRGLPRAGLVWAGNPRKELPGVAAVDRQRSIAPERLGPLFDPPGARFVSLQKDGPRLAAHFPIEDFMDEVADFADTAALVANLDVVVSVDTAVAHLAGALGKPVWLLDRFDPCWRWLRGRRDSPWYPGLTIYRQSRPGDWEAVLAEVRLDLAGFA